MKAYRDNFMIKKMTFYSIIIFVLFLSSCVGYKREDYFGMLVKNNNIDNLSYSDLKYFFHYTSGFEDRRPRKH